VHLRQAVGSELPTADHAGQASLLCCSVPRAEQTEAAQRLHAHPDAGGGPGPGDLLGYLQLDLVGLPVAALLLRVGQAQQAAWRPRREARVPPAPAQPDAAGLCAQSRPGVPARAFSYLNNCAWQQADRWVHR
jgi:hypothetical protein